ncbi:Transposable element tcb1 transposase [Caligus rogercresseyi]|uniref:Transposable element tcb1 transposase n=1 Tax=Caligus rogercresseyi TaxID=217165 RepID=A0A7T8KCX7_CALRO|nr:Transposable element tcb1 transposase [Caligus rogercresseyi]
MCFNKTVHKLIRLIWYKIGSQSICPCSGRKRCGPLARQTATRWTTACGHLGEGIQQACSQQCSLAEGLHCGGSGKHEQGAPCQCLHEVPVQAGGGHRS